MGRHDDGGRRSGAVFLWERGGLIRLWGWETGYCERHCFGRGGHLLGKKIYGERWIALGETVLWECGGLLYKMRFCGENRMWYKQALFRKKDQLLYKGQR